MRRALALSCLLLAFGCSDSDDSGTGGGGAGGSGSGSQGSVSSCDLTADVGYCLDWDANVPAGTAKGNCDGAKTTLGLNGTVSESGSCPTAGRVGSCTATVTGVVTTYRYYAPKWDAAKAEENCKLLPQGPGAFTKG